MRGEATHWLLYSREEGRSSATCERGMLYLMYWMEEPKSGKDMWR